MSDPYTILPLMGAAEGSYIYFGQHKDLRYTATFASGSKTPAKRPSDPPKSGLSFGVMQFDVANNTQAATIFQTILDYGVLNNLVSRADANKIFALADTKGLYADAFGAQNLATINTIFSQPWVQSYIDTNDILKVSSLDGVISNIFSAARTSWASQGVTDSPFLTEGTHEYYTLWTYIGATLNKTADFPYTGLNYDTIKSWLSGDPVTFKSGASFNLSAPPSLGQADQFFESFKAWSGGNNGLFNELKGRIDPLIESLDPGDTGPEMWPVAPLRAFDPLPTLSGFDQSGDLLLANYFAEDPSAGIPVLVWTAWSFDSIGGAVYSETRLLVDADGSVIGLSVTQGAVTRSLTAFQLEAMGLYDKVQALADNARAQPASDANTGPAQLTGEGPLGITTSIDGDTISIDLAYQSSDKDPRSGSLLSNEQSSDGGWTKRYEIAPQVDENGDPVVVNGQAVYSVGPVHYYQNGLDVKITNEATPDQRTEIHLQNSPIKIDFADAGQVIGNVLGSYLAPSGLLGQTLGPGILSAVLDDFGQALNSAITGQGVGESLDAAFSDFGQDLGDSIEGAGLSELASLLTAQLVHSLGLSGVEAGAANTIANFAIGKIIDNLAAIAGGGQNINIFGGLDPSELGNAAASFVGSELANKIADWDEVGEQLGSSIGSALGAQIGTALLPGIGTAIGAFLGDLIGGFIGGLFTGTPKSGAIVGFDEAIGGFAVESVWKEDGGSKRAARALGDAVAASLNDIVSFIGGELVNGSQIDAGSYGMRGKRYVYWQDGTASDDQVRFSKPDDLIDYGTLKAAAEFEFLGGDIYAKRAFYATMQAGLRQSTGAESDSSGLSSDAQPITTVDFGLDTLLGNFAVVDRLKTYLASSASINALIAAEPNSAFAADWLLALSRATDLGLQKRSEHDWDGGFSYLLGAASTDARDVQFGFHALGDAGNGERVILLESGELDDTIDSGSKTIIHGSDDADVLTSRVGGSRSDTIDPSNIRHIADVFYGGSGDDIIIAGDTGDDLFGDNGNDILVGGKLDDWLVGGSGNDVLDAGGGNGNFLSGGDGNDYLLGADRPISASREVGSDWLSGGAGDDVIAGRGGNDFIDGDKGNDWIDGGSGGDTVIFRAGDGTDDLTDTGASVKDRDTLDFGEEVATSDVAVIAHSSGVNLSLLIGGAASGDRLNLRGAVTDLNEGMEEYRFAEASWSKTDLTSDVVFAKSAGIAPTGTAADETITGTIYDDTLSGGGGQDALQGGEGSDTYLFNLGDGVVLIDDVGAAVDVDVVQFGVGITRDDLAVSVDPESPQDLIVKVGAGGDQLILRHQDVADGAGSIEELRFADGTSLTLRDLEDMGTGLAFAGRVADAPPTVWTADLNGSDADETYSYSPGDGDVRINETLWSSGDALIFGTGIDPDHVVVTRDPADSRDVWIRFSDQPGSVLLNDQDNGYSSGVEEIQFADGTVWDRATLDQKIVDRAASAGADRILDSYGSTTIIAGAGDDYVDAGGGDDTITGGAGDDNLNGGDGSDTYVYNVGDGNDRITESLWSGGDAISFGAGITTGDVVVTRDVLDTRNIRISFTDHAGSILIEDQDNGYSSGIEELRFADGTVWDRDAINPQIVDQASSAGKDIIRNGYGPVTIDAGAGDDYVEAGDGADTITGGVGDDELNGGDGSDTYVYNVGDGNDRITESLWSPGDAISFGAGITTGDVVVTRDVLDTRNIRISFTDHAGSILIEDQDNGYSSGIEELRFDDGTVWDRDTINAQIVGQASSASKDIIRNGYGPVTIEADAGDDYVEAGDGADTITGGAGDDNLNGGDGSDTYVYNVGDGNDRIVESLWSGGDAISFGTGITTGDVVVTRDVLDTRNIRVSFTDHAGSILIEDQDNGYSSGIEELHFADGAVWDRDTINAQIVDQASSAGKDIIRNGYGPVTIDAGAGDDYVEAGDGADTITGGAGDDNLNGGDGSDTYVYNVGDGNDRITESLWSGGDAISFGTGITTGDVVVTRDVLDTRNIRISFTDHAGSILIEDQDNGYSSGIEELRFADGTVWDRATINASVATRAADIVGDTDANELVGTAGVDQIYGADGNDVLTGGLGDDFLNGGADNDTYIYNLGDGSDTILDDSGSLDTLRFGTGISASDLVLSAATVDGDNLGMVIGIAGTDDRITLRDQNWSAGHTIERFEFADGTVLSAADLRTQLMTSVVSGGDDKVYGTSWGDAVNGGGGDDEINTSDGDDTLTGGAGNDVLNGGADNDTYIYNLGDGSDTIFDDAGSSDTLRFGAGISASDLVLSASAVDGDTLGLVIGIAGTDDRITIRNQNWGAGHNIDRFEFADGTALSAADLRAQLMTSVVGSGDDKIYGTSWGDAVNGGAGDDEINTSDGDDTLTGGAGNDVLNGGGDNDTYVYNLGDGSDTIFDDSGNSDTLRFGAGISASDLVLSAATVDGDTLGLVIGIAGTDDRITIRDQNWGGGHTIERFEFADGTVLTAADLRAQLMTAVVSSDDDKVYGTSWADSVDGGGGDDEISTGDGNDILTGGKGNDVLDGGADNDTYVFNRGDGFDTITDGAGNDTLQFAEGIDESDVTVSRALVDGDASGVVLSIKGTSDSVYLRSEFDGNRIDTISFISGATWSVATLQALLGGTVVDGNPLPVTMGDDTIVGGSGDDTLSGLKGDDVLRGGAGSDTYRFARGDGHDTIYDPTDIGASDTLVLEGINPADVKVMASPTDLDDLILYIDDESVIYLDQQNVSGSSGIEQVQFDDGTTWTRATLAAFAANGQGTDGNDTLIGTNFSDTLTGGLGNDTLIGSAGNDTYVYDAGDGDDTIVDDNAAGDDPSQPGNPANVDTLSLGTGITLASLVLTQPVADGPLVISFSDQPGSITLQGLNPGGRSGVELIRFSDGSSVTLDALRAATIAAAATTGNDLIRGFATPDSLDGGAGDDTLAGGAGGDSYHFGLGSGADTIIETADGSTNRLVFGAGIWTGDVRLRRSAAAPDDLILSLSDGSDSVTLKNQFANGGSAGLQEIHFDDGTVWLAKDFAAIELAQPATAEADYLVGDDAANTIDGLGGDDTIIGGAGDDTLNGSDGNDTLFGGAGNDVLHGGAGDDILSGDTGTDTLDGGDGFDTADYSFSLDRWAIDLSSGTATIVTSGASTQVETLTGIEAVISGLGSDTITGDDGANRLQGGGGNDILAGAGGDDVFVFDGDEDGVDAIDGGSGTDRIEAVSDGTVIGLSSLTGVEQIDASGHADVIIAATDGPDSLDLSGAVLTGIASIQLGGGNDTITGALGADVINAGDGDDIIRYVGISTGGDQVDGGAGNDTIVADADDTVIRVASFQNVEAISGAGFANVVLARTDASETTDISSLPVSGIAYIDLAGGDDSFVGSANADVVRGGGGDDVLSGGTGDDVFQYAEGASGFDAVDGGGGDDRLLAVADGAVIGLQSIANVEEIDGAGFANVTIGLGDGDDHLDLSGVTLTGIVGIVGGKGDDVLVGSAGDDTFLVAGSDQGVDSFDGGAGDDRILAGADGTVISLSQIANVETVDGGGYDDVRLAATDGNDSLALQSVTLSGISEIDLGAGDDNFAGSAGADIVSGGLGNDTLSGGTGDDVYLFDRGDGNDVIREKDADGVGGGDDTLRLSADIATGDVQVTRVNGGSDYLLTIANGGGTVLIVGDAANDSAAWVENIEFAEGTVWTRDSLNQAVVPFTDGDDDIQGTDNAETLHGGGGDDTITAYGGDDLIYGDADNDTIESGAGNDRVIGGTGNDVIWETGGDDTYVWNRGDGNDRLQNYGWWDGYNTLELGPDISASDLTFTRDGTSSDIKISVAGDTGSFTLVDGLNAYSDGSVDLIKFADGSTLSHADYLAATVASQETSGNDDIYASRFDDVIDGGAGDDTINPNDGNDRVTGGAGNNLIWETGGDDTYVWNRGDGIDRLQNYGWWDGYNTLEFGADISGSDLTFTRDGTSSDIRVSIAGESGSFILVDGLNAYDDGSIDIIKFADGSTISRADYIAAAIASQATAGNDDIYGSRRDDMIDGGAGDDTINPNDGNDRVTGGAGDNLIWETGGDDTYVWNRGDGNDRLQNYGWWDGYNTLEFGPNIAVSDLTFTRDGTSSDIRVSIAGESGSFILVDGLNAYDDGSIDVIKFADGSTLSRADYMASAVASQASSGNDDIYGSRRDDAIVGGAGDDTINPNEGNDSVTGGPGNNLIWETRGDDTYIWNRGDGVDTIRNFGWWDGYDTVQFGAGINPDDLVVWYEGNDIHIGIDGEAGSVVLENQRYTGDGIDRILFADGTSWDRPTFLAHAIAATSENDSLVGTSGADTLRGLGGNDSISGLAGNDQLSGDAGDDILDGGVDDDVLIGGSGDDTLYGDGYVATGSNLIVNGSFEELGSNLDYQPWGIWSTDIPGWTKTNSGRYNQVNSGNDGTLATDGQFLMDLDDAGGPGSNMDIRQTVGSLTAGQKLLLSFDHGNPLHSDSGFFQVYWNGDLIATITDVSTQTQATQILVTATAGDNELRFQGTGAEDGMGAQIDNIQLFATQPETGGDDTLTGGAGNDYLDGGAGNDTAVFAGVSTDYSVVTSDGVVTVTDDQPTIDGDDGTDTLTGIESLQFADGTTSLAAPIVLDLNGNGVKLISAGVSRTKFDWNDDGIKDASGWIGKGDGLLFLDRDGDGRPDSAKELSFVDDKPGAKSDLDGLSAFDGNKDGLLSDLDDRFEDFRVWIDRNGDGVAGRGEVLTLKQAGVASINLVGDPTHGVWNAGDNIVINNGTFTRTSGRKGKLADVAISYTAHPSEKIVPRMTVPHVLGGGGWQQVAASRLAEAMASHVTDKGTTSFDTHRDWAERREPWTTMTAHVA